MQETARKLITQAGYADLLFLDDAGRVVYTTTKGKDFGQAVTEDGLKDTALARLVQRLKTADPSAALRGLRGLSAGTVSRPPSSAAP